MPGKRSAPKYRPIPNSVHDRWSKEADSKIRLKKARKLLLEESIDFVAKTSGIPMLEVPIELVNDWVDAHKFLFAAVREYESAVLEYEANVGKLEEEKA